MSKFRRILGVSLLVLVLALTAILAVGCSGGGAKKPDKVNEASIIYDGATISWEAAKNAYSYKIEINGTEIGSTPTTSIAYSTANDSITVKITPLGKKDNAGKSSTMTFNRLGGGEDLVIYFDENGNASWDAIPGATAYIVEVNGKSEKITSNMYLASNFKLGQQNRIRVKPSSTGNGTFSSWSNYALATFLAAPSNIAFDGSRITWKGSSEAKSYEIYINGSLFETVEAGGAMSKAYNPEGQSFNLSMRTIGNGTNIFTSPMSEESRFVYLSRVDNFTVSDGTVSWPAVADAAKYEVKINTKTIFVTEPVIKNLTTGVDNIISVKPHGESKEVTYFSEWSNEERVHIIRAPQSSWDSSLTLDGQEQNAFMWGALTGVQGYSVKVVKPDGTAENFEASSFATSFGYAFLEPGEYEISVKANPIEGSGYYESSYSQPIKIVRLAAPDAAIDGLITSTGLTEDFKIHLKDQSSYGATGYTVYKEGYPIIQNHTRNVIPVSDVIDSNVRTEQSYTFAVRAIGEGRLTSSRTVVLSSLTSSMLEFPITVLEAPTNVTIMGHTISWDTVQKASSYIIEGFTGATSTQSSYTLSSSTITPGTYSVMIRAKGNGANILSSPMSDALRIRKLDAPTNLHIISSGEQEGRIEFTKIDGIDSYELCFNANPQYYDANSIDNINEFITENTVSVKVRAVADSYDDEGQIYCLTSEFSTEIRLTKLSAPTWPETYHDEKSVLWNAPANYNSTPQYLVYNGSSLAFQGTYNKTSFSLESFEGGQQYTFYVRAVGDGVTTLTSDLSEARTVTKLADPVVEVAADRLSYIWKHVDGAQRYVVRVENIVVDTIDAASGEFYYKFTPSASNFTKGPAKYAITVTATNDEYIDSKPARMDLTVKNISMPNFSISYSEESFSRAGKIIVTAEATDLDHTMGFVYNIDGKTSDVITETTFEYTTSNTGVYTANVTAASSRFHVSDDAVYFINSLQAPTQKITLLSAPGMAGVYVSQTGTLNWKAVEGAIRGYEVYVDYGDGTTSEIYSISSNSSRCDQFDIYDPEGNPDGKFVIEDAATYTFYIRAKGNGTTLIASEWLVWDMSQQ